MTKQRFTKEELEQTVKIGDVVQIITPFIAGIGFLSRLEERTLVLTPLDEETIKNYTPKTDETLAEGLQDTQAPITVPATVIIPLADIHLVFNLTNEPITQNGK